ncbi:tyrosine-type recombinase/integrase [Vibrio harveyi]|uniref:tyrosine-type recombinase/integrase n=1 Tax=Vibrio harveyi TaxID=669 RepID=UPI0025AFECB7|nr:site-specific integrase [Vibrio harveyi]WJT09229.1 site-specific integrase [Vibrio harveyi]
MKLTEKFLKSKKANSEGKQFKDFPDGGGLVARVFKTGSISFYYRFRWQGSQAVAKIGSYPAVSLKEARETHQTMRSGRDRGVDPRARLMTHDGVTMQEGFERWYEGYLKDNRKDPVKTRKHFEKHILPKYGTMILDEIKIPEWERILRIKSAPVLSGLMLRECKAMCGYLIRKQIITNELIRYIKIAEIGKMPNKRDRVYNRTELKKVWDWCNDPIHPIEYRFPLFAAMVFGCRIGEVAMARKKEFDFENRIWTVPKEHSKAGIQIFRPIPEFMDPLFKELDELFGKRRLLLVPNRKGEEISPKTLSMRVNIRRDQIGVEGMICHSFRHTLSTNYANLGIEPHIAEKQLGHLMGGSMQIYNRGMYLDQIAEAMAKYKEWIHG